MNINKKDLPKFTPKYSILEGRFGDEIYVSDPKEDGYTAYFKDFPKIVTQGKTIKEAQERLWMATYDVVKFFFNDKKKI